MKTAVNIVLSGALLVAALGACGAGREESVVSFDEVTFALGPESTPTPTPTDPDPRPETTVWDVGESATAFVQDGVLYVRGSGAVTSMPWTAVAGTVEKLKIAEDITSIPLGSLAGMDSLTQVNGLALGVFNGVAAGAVKGGGFTAIAIDPSTHTGTVTFRVKRAADVTAPEDAWTPVDATGTTTDATLIRVPIQTDLPAGFFRVLPD